MGQDPSKRRRRRTLKPEAVPTIFQHVPQPKASTQHKHSSKRTVKSEREEAVIDFTGTSASDGTNTRYVKDNLEIAICLIRILLTNALLYKQTDKVAKEIHNSSLG
ncbi:hypothetical protein LSAT2_017299 [Lamellibrachia satsuma]|nr:hypothetical protein LSAT2_017299 [Lamellibrachia satsuma]